MSYKLLLGLSLFIGFSPTAIGQQVYSADAAYKADVKVFVVDEAYQADLLVYKEDAAYQADGNEGHWFFTDAEYKADKIVFFTDAEYQADLTIFFVNERYKAGWQEPEKIHLMY